MIIKVMLKIVLREIRLLNSLVNGKKRIKPPFKLFTLSTLGPDSIVLWCGDVQSFIPAEVLDAGGMVFNVTKFIAILETFKDEYLEIWTEKSTTTLKTVGQKFSIEISGTENYAAFRKDHLLYGIKSKKRKDKAVSDLIETLKMSQEVSFIDNDGQIQTGAIFLRFADIGGQIMAQIATHDRKVVMVNPEKIGCVFNHRKIENPLSRKML